MHHFCAVFNCMLQPTESNIVMSYLADFWGYLSPTNVKFGDPRLNLSQEIPPEAAFSMVFSR